MNVSIARKTLGLLLAGSLLAGAAVTLPSTVLAAETVKEQATNAKVNINTADAQTLADLLLGVGMAKAKAIVKFREERGKFTNVEQLREVNGIGQSILNLNRQRITLE